MFLVSPPFYAIFSLATSLTKNHHVCLKEYAVVCVSVFCVFPPPLFYRHGNGDVAELTIATSRGL